jgi:hypothetical protein
MDFFSKASGNSVMTITDSGVIMPNRTGARDYYVDLNRSSAGGGLTWDDAFTTIAAAITASNTSIGLTANRWWARRNTINVVGDGINEDLTVLPEKCDVIGWGADLYDHPRVTGNHVIAAAAVGTRFINMGFNAETNADIFDIPAGCYGISFINCDFTPMITGAAKALEIDDAAGIRIVGCNFQIGAGGPSYFTLAIDIEGTIHHDCLIADNKIIGVAGIQISDAAANCFGSSMERNAVRATTGLPIDDDSDDWMTIDNRMITEINIATTTAGYDFNLALSSGNILTGLNGVAATIPFAVTAE